VKTGRRGKVVVEAEAQPQNSAGELYFYLVKFLLLPDYSNE